MRVTDYTAGIQLGLGSLTKARASLGHMARDEASPWLGLV